MAAHTSVPRHVAVILDGNRRWAVANGLSIPAGYRQGASKVGELFDWCVDTGIDYVTVWALSLTNLLREPREVTELLGVIVDQLRELAGRHRWRIRVIGALDVLPVHIQRDLAGIAAATEDVRSVQANVALAYDGRDEIVRAVRALAKDLAANRWTPDHDSAADEDALARYLYTGGQPDPDLVIRTSGERRLSGFMPWQTAQAEFYFCDTAWPAFTRDDFDRALAEFAKRNRRFGR
jgi:short-chain Z-isoprenyl diphosphate synthase